MIFIRNGCPLAVLATQFSVCLPFATFSLVRLDTYFNQSHIYMNYLVPSLVLYTW